MKLSTHGILFFGTPHHGGNGVTLGELVLRIASVAITTSDRAMKNLRKESEWLETQLGQYSAISQDFDTTFLYESYPTPLPVGSTMVSGSRFCTCILPTHRVRLFQKLPQLF